MHAQANRKEPQCSRYGAIACWQVRVVRNSTVNTRLDFFKRSWRLDQGHIKKPSEFLLEAGVHERAGRGWRGPAGGLGRAECQPTGLTSFLTICAGEGGVSGAGRVSGRSDLGRGGQTWDAQVQSVGDGMLHFGCQNLSISRSRAPR